MWDFLPEFIIAAHSRGRDEGLWEGTGANVLVWSARAVAFKRS